MHAAFAGDEQCLCGEDADERPTWLSRSRQIQSLERRVILDVVRRRAVGFLPDDIACVHVVRRDPVVWWFHQWQTLNSRAASSRARAAGTATSRRTRPGATGSRLFAALPPLRR